MPTDRICTALCSRSKRSFFACLLVVMLSAALGAAQKTAPSASVPPKYDLHTETKAKGLIDEVNQLPWGPKLDITELILKSGEEKLHVYVCPKAFQDEIGVTFAKGDDISVTGSKVKQDTQDVILVRELVKGTDTLVFRDDKGSPVWNEKTGK
ncbi:MAG: hypothetical protein ACLQLC_18085 [Candidatus Sulfotelmatobacter sp.]